MHHQLGIVYPPQNHQGPHDNIGQPPDASPRGLIPPPPAMFSAGVAARPPAGPHPLNTAARSPGSFAASAYPPQYTPSSTSPSTASGGTQEIMTSSEPAISSAGLSPSHMPLPGLSASKRAYRQRRKDPSCDACRERKVKCDATETSSCSECSSRSVKCQFTKETNRRMSSIKQVQDLQSQLQEAKQQINHLRSMLQDGGAMDVDSRTGEATPLKLPEIGPHAERRHGTPPLGNFDHVRKNLRIYGRGIFKAPPPYRPIAPPTQFSTASGISATPPAKQIAYRLLDQYYGSIHAFFPLLHWPSFKEEVDRIYSRGSFQGSPQRFVAMFFAVLACGTLQTLSLEGPPDSPRADVEGTEYMKFAVRTVNTWTDEITVDQARTTLLLSIYFTELDMKSAGWIWLGSSVKMSQDIGLHVETGPWSLIDGEVRRRVWWAIYTWDRLVSLELGRPLMIDDDDCDVSWPSPIEDRFIQTNGFVKPQPGDTVHNNNLAAIIPVVRFISQLKKTLKTRIIAPATLKTYDDYFMAVMASFPENYQLHSTTSIEPWCLPTVFTLQMARFFLYRHNLSTACHPEDRLDALRRCYSVAQDTVRYISRTLQSTASSPNHFDPSHYHAPHSQKWQSQILAAASNNVCTHMWRCTLMLCFHRDYEAALTCVRVSATISDLRKVNIACGRNLAFFLDRLCERIRSGHGSLQQLEVDEEMLAYVSGDMQGSLESAWAWAGSETGMKLNISQLSPTYSSPRINGELPDDGYATPPSGARLSEKEAKEWGGWERVERTLLQLISGQHTPQPPPQRPFPPPPPQFVPQPSVTPPNSNGHLMPPEVQMPAPGGVSPLGSSSRISIANII